MVNAPEPFRPTRLGLQITQQLGELASRGPCDPPAFRS